MRDRLPELLAEIAEITDVGTALAVAEAKGGTTATIAAHLTSDNWLVKAVGMDKATIISKHFTSGRRLTVYVPLGPCNGTYKAEQRRRAEAFARAQAEGASAAAIAQRLGITDRSVYRARRKLKTKLSNQGTLF
jgi:hypothetical protein